jgi:hypothetical protein
MHRRSEPMSTEEAGELQWAGFDELIPGCAWRIVEPYDTPIKAGIRAEQERLSGKHWLVVALVWSMDYDMVHREIRLDAAFDDPDEAWVRAQHWQQELVALQRAEPGWISRDPEPAEWPDSRKDALAAGSIRRLPVQCIDRPPYDCHRINVAVIQLDPVMPISNTLLLVIDRDSELQAHFRKLGESLGFGVRRAPPLAHAAAPARTSTLSRLWNSRSMRYLVGAFLGIALYVIVALHAISHFHP